MMPERFQIQLMYKLVAGQAIWKIRLIADNKYRYACDRLLLEKDMQFLLGHRDRIMIRSVDNETVIDQSS